MISQRKGIIKSLEDLIVYTDSIEQKHKILIVGTECSPFSSAGGVSSVIAYLSKEISSLGHDIRVFTPRFGFIDEEKYDLEVVYTGLKVPTGEEATPYLVCNIKKAIMPGTNVTVYFLENEEYYEKRANVYNYSDDPTRWALLSRGALEFIKTKIFIPDIIHANDWHTGLISNYLENDYKNDPVLDEIASVFTIHNLSIQGMYLDHMNTSELDFDDGRSDISDFFNERLNKQNFMRRGILYADIVNTVSHKYAKEVLTPEYGEGLDKLLLELKGKFFGIVNGIDYEEFNPYTDKLLKTNYDVHSLSKRVENKLALQKEFDLPARKDILLLGFVGRLDYQKGVDLIINTVKKALQDYDLQFVQVGGGDAGLTRMLEELKSLYPNNVGIHPYFNSSLPRLVFGGCDCILYPSRFEPCGVVQLEAMRYGAVPIVRKVGGLADTVDNFDSTSMEGTGFVFSEFDEFSLYGQIIRAVELIKHKKIWKKLQENAMKKDFSWSYSAKEYIRLYELALTFRSNKHLTLHE